MQLNEFPYFASDVINFATDENLSRLIVNQPIQLLSYDEQWLLQQNEERIVVDCGKKERPLLSGLMRRNQTRWMLSHKSKNSLQLQYMAPVETSALDLTLGVDGLISDDLFTKNEIVENSIELACGWLVEHFVVSVANTSDSVSLDTLERHWLAISRFSNSSTGKGFQLLGKGWRADVEEQNDGRYLIKRITRHARRDSGFSLISGAITFTDVSAAAALSSATAQAVLDAALRDNGSYLELWNLYNDKEWQNELKKAETLKALRFSHTESFEDGRTNRWRVWPKSREAYQIFQVNWRGLELNKSTQVDLSERSPDWAEELTVENGVDGEQGNPRGQIRFETDYLIFTPSSDRIVTTPNFSKENNGGWLYLSLAGQRTAGIRRLSARQAIESGKRMPQLKWLLEGVSVPSDRHRKLKGLSQYAKETFKGGKPTGKQLLALETALNTPDIAIIIGPPGTGKTQVIAALQRRLAEEFEQQNISGQVLVSSFQHDAVDNALERSQVFNLPATRVGGKKQSADEEGSFSRWIDAQSDYLKKQVNEQYQKAPFLKKLDEISLAITLLRMSQFSRAQYIERLEDLFTQLKELQQQSVRVSSRLLSEFEDYITEHEQSMPVKSNRNNTQILRCIRGLRVTELSFADDGRERASDLLRELKRQIHRFNGESRELLQRASATVLPDNQLLYSLNELKNQLLDQYLPDYRPPELKHTLDQEAIGLLDRLEESLAQYMQQHKQGVAWALQELVDSIETDRLSALNTTEEYAMVVGATCQQSASNKMANLKSIVDIDSSDIEFDTVVIDEAARANPLDLFIPMSMAKRRVILVGDDRQLPHMLEPDIEGQLQEEHLLTEQQLTAFKSSLFERLRLQLDKLDDYPRVIMLDTQFRMHPVLGDFVSQQFYESIGLEKVEAGRGAEDFSFQRDFIVALGSEGKFYDKKVCQWINVPLSDGKNSKSGTSWAREAEADCIATEVQRLFEAAGNSLSIGIITFYSAQRDLIMEKLASKKVNGVSLMVKREGQYEPNDAFRWAVKKRKDGTTEKEEGLRVGSVDAFQGKEFDVVLLSCVRTWQEPKAKLVDSEENEVTVGEHHEVTLNRMFGFLRLPNRMNVAMSRQRQMLVCVGDSQLATNEYATEGVPALNAFYKLCGGKYGCLR